ncbi:MAG TPA: hypothetical protein VLH84_03615 [Patescibacteria group bacterium]|nr:hypothetical protein [Patescibacteria group bacterium]
MAKKNLREFDYIKTAQLDTDMWRAYYGHNFFLLFVLLLRLMRTQFQFSRRLALRAAYYAAIAATNYRLRYGRKTFPVALKNLAKFYLFISRNATEPFDYTKAAELELEWWNIHRYPEEYDKKLSVSLAATMAVVYNGNTKDFLRYGEYRARAMILRDNSKSRPDWEEIDSLLKASWKALHDVAQKG